MIYSLGDEILKIRINGIKGEFKLSVYNIQGQKIEAREINCTIEVYSVSIDVSGYPNGTYIIEISDGQLKKTAKFVIWLRVKRLRWTLCRNEFTLISFTWVYYNPLSHSCQKP